jgi:DHA1 family multidrug resistance protein-like MFS transporter
VFGRLSDRVGHRRVLVASAYAVGVLIAPQAFVANVWQFLGLRILSTASGAAMMPATNALVATFMPARQYGGAYGVLGSSRTLAFAIAPIVGGIVAAQFGIRVTFILCAALSLIAATWVQYGLGKGPEEGLVEDEAEADLLPPSEALGTDSGADG